MWTKFVQQESEDNDVSGFPINDGHTGSTEGNMSAQTV